MPTGTEKQCAYREPSLATKAEAMPYARWLHKGESHSHKAADLKKLCASFLHLLSKHGKAGINCSASDST